MQNLDQFAYNDELVEMCGGDVERLPKWRQAMYKATGEWCASGSQEVMCIKKSGSGVYQVVREWCASGSQRGNR